VRLNRPERLNAIGEEDREALLRALARIRRDAGLRAAIVTGAGRGFCAGGDLDRLLALRERGDTRGFARILDRQLAVTRAIRTMPQIVIAAINGPCGGAGLDIALACDLRLAARSATFGAPFLRLGILPDATALGLLPRVAGRAAALEMFLRAEFVSAREAECAGLVSRVVADARLQAEARALAAVVASRPPALVAHLKRALSDRAERATDSGWRVDPTRREQLAAFRAPESLHAIRGARRRARPARSRR
jgi:2-(1,2-epoxy-1,2-dihydrophenyl)acetyl-CoA isomerase